MPRIQQVQNYRGDDDVALKPVIKKSLYAGAIGALGAYLLLGETTGQLAVAGTNVPAAVGLGVACSGGSIAGDLLSGYIIDKLDQSQGVKTMESELIKLGVSSAGCVGTMSFIYGIEPSLTGALLGGGSKFAADSVYNQYDPNLLGMLF